MSLMIKASRFNEEVYFAREDIAAFGTEEIEWLKSRAAENRRTRCRLCLHHDIDAAVHEMLIVHKQGIYVPPHKHLTKTESIHIIEGLVDLVCFTDDGKVRDVVRLGEKGRDARVYCRMIEGIYHSLVILSEWMVAHETTTGPFHNAVKMVYATWAPGEDEPAAGARFLSDALSQRAGRQG